MSGHENSLFPRFILYIFFSFLLIYDGLGLGVLGLGSYIGFLGLGAFS